MAGPVTADHILVLVLHEQILFSKTVGPVKEVFMVYNSQGKSRGMAVVTFVRAGDAAVARVKYNGKIVDGRKSSFASHTQAAFS